MKHLQGELCNYVVEELNVRQLTTCSNPLQYATLRAEPNFAVLGKRIGKAMGILSKTIKNMPEEDILHFKKSGYVTLENHKLTSEDITIKHEFCYPSDDAENVDAASGDEDIMVIMELTVDQSLLAAGHAREFVNRVQKLRKSAGLQTADTVSVYFEPAKDNSKEANEIMFRMIQSEQVYLEENLGSCPQLLSLKPTHAVVLAKDSSLLSNGARFHVTLTCPSVTLDAAAILRACNGFKDLADAVSAVILSREYSSLKHECESSEGGVLIVKVNGAEVKLYTGSELAFAV